MVSCELVILSKVVLLISTSLTDRRGPNSACNWPSDISISLLFLRSTYDTLFKLEKMSSKFDWLSFSNRLLSKCRYFTQVSGAKMSLRKDGSLITPMPVWVSLMDLREEKFWQMMLSCSWFIRKSSVSCILRYKRDFKEEKTIDSDEIGSCHNPTRWSERALSWPRYQNILSNCFSDNDGRWFHEKDKIQMVNMDSIKVYSMQIQSTKHLWISENHL